MANINKTTQYSTFTLIRDILITNTSIKNGFGSSRIYEYDPLPKSKSFSGYPYLVINSPGSDTDPLTINKADSNKTFIVTIHMYNTQSAKDKITDHINAIVGTIELSHATLKSSGYKLMEVDNKGTVPEIAYSKDIFHTRIEINMEGIVSRR